MAASSGFPLANVAIIIGGIGFTAGQVLDKPIMISVGMAFGIVGLTVFIVSVFLNRITKKSE